jgi:hypothetical protein
MLLVFKVQEILLFWHLRPPDSSKKKSCSPNERNFKSRSPNGYLGGKIDCDVRDFGSDQQLRQAGSVQTAEDIGGGYEFVAWRGLDRV